MNEQCGCATCDYTATTYNNCFEIIKLLQMFKEGGGSLPWYIGKIYVGLLFANVISVNHI